MVVRNQEVRRDILSLAYKRASERWLRISDHFSTSRREGNRHCLSSTGCETSRKPWLSMSCRSQRQVHSTHTEAQSSVGLSVPDTKDQGPLAGMHIPTAAVVRPAQQRVIGIIGARQRILNTGTTWTTSTNRHVSGGHAIHQMSDIKRHNKKVYSIYRQTCSESGIFCIQLG